MRRRTIASITLMVFAAFAVAGWFAGTFIRAPAEVAARTAAPEPSAILVPVEERVLSTDVVTRGTARFGSPRTLVIAPSRLKDERRMVTRVPKLGELLEQGAVALTVSGRPVIVLEGAEPGYRDLGRGMAGTDIRQLEAALRRLGIEPGPVDGLFDNETARAVRELYDQIGFTPLVARDEQLADARPPEAAVLADARAEPGVQVPADEVIFVPSLPLRVTELLVAPGDEPAEGLLTATDVDVAIDSALPLEEATLIQPGMSVTIDEPDLGISKVGVVTRVADTPGTDGVDGFHVYFEVSVAGAPPTVVGASVRLTLPIESTGDRVLAVPVSALSLASDGSSRVQRSTDLGIEDVAVEPGLSADGFVAVSTVDGTLVAGELVVVGFENPAGVAGQ